jgi:hypothetical protein
MHIIWHVWIEAYPVATEAGANIRFVPEQAHGARTGTWCATASISQVQVMPNLKKPMQFTFFMKMAFWTCNTLLQRLSGYICKWSSCLKPFDQLEPQGQKYNTKVMNTTIRG